MAKTDRAQFVQVLRQAEAEMTAMFDRLAEQIGDVVLRAAGPDGKVPVERLRDVQMEVHRLVDQALLGPMGRPFSDDNSPQSPFAQVLYHGQVAMIDNSLERQAKMLDRVMPQDVRDGLARRYRQGAV